jgi:hypothetical protein
MLSSLVAFVLSGLGPTNQAMAIQEGEFRAGLLAGNLQLMGKQAAIGSGLGFGLNFGYMFADDMLFNLDYISGTVGKSFSQSQTAVGVAYYIQHHNTVFYSLTGGMSIVNNQLKVGSESVSAGGSGFYFGAGLDFDLSSRFVAGFTLRYNSLAQGKRSTDSGIEVVAMDNFLSTLLKVAYVF